MKVLILITKADLGGAQRHVVDLLEGLRDEYDLHLGAGEEGYLTESAARLSVPVHIVPDLVQPISPLRDSRAVLQLRRLMARLKPDLIHAHTSKAGFAGRAAAAWSGIPSVFTAHTWCFAEGTSRKWKLIGTPLERLAARWSGAIINVSEANRRLAVHNAIRAAGEMLTVHNGVADTPERADPAAPVPVVAMVARCSPQKDQAALLTAAAGIDLPYRIEFAGDGPTRPALEALVGQLGLRAKVSFLGERRDIASVLASSQIFALPTHWEGFPLSILEAMRAGLPVAASGVGGVCEAVEDGQTGFLSPAGDIAGLRRNLMRLIGDPDLRARLGRAGRARFEQEFTVNVMLRRTSEVYRRTAGRTGLAPVAAAADELVRR